MLCNYICVLYTLQSGGKLRGIAAHYLDATGPSTLSRRDAISGQTYRPDRGVIDARDKEELQGDALLKSCSLVIKNFFLRVRRVRSEYPGDFCVDIITYDHERS